MIPWLNTIGGQWQERINENEHYFIHYYRTIVDPSFTRIEKWTDKATRKEHWRVHSLNNQVMVFGKSPDPSSQVHDPRDPLKIFQWLLESHYDNLRNSIEYEYVADDLANIDGNLCFERTRVFREEGNGQKYIKRIRYGNTTPIFPDDPPSPSQHWLFEVVFDYREHEANELPFYATLPQGWPVRQDPFSTYIAGFEQRTYRLCPRIMMFHHIEELGAGPTLAGITTLRHTPNPASTTLTEIQYHGYRRSGMDRYESKALPPVVFTYTSPEVARSFHAAPEQSTYNIPFGLGGMNYKWIDLYGEGLPGVLYESNECWYYKPNLAMAAWAATAGSFKAKYQSRQLCIKRF